MGYRNIKTIYVFLILCCMTVLVIPAWSEEVVLKNITIESLCDYLYERLGMASVISASIKDVTMDVNIDFGKKEKKEIIKEIFHDNKTVTLFAYYPSNNFYVLLPTEMIIPENPHPHAIRSSILDPGMCEKIIKAMFGESIECFSNDKRNCLYISTDSITEATIINVLTEVENIIIEMKKRDGP